MNPIKMYYQIGNKKHFKWQCITFSDGSNPYICKNEKEFNKLKNKYNLVHVDGCCWRCEQWI
jgi:hypothetical protein